MANSKDGQDHIDKHFDTSRKILSQETLMCKMKALALTVQKFFPKLKFFKNGSNSQVKVTVSKIMVPTERSYLKEYSCEISKLLHLLKTISNVFIKWSLIHFLKTLTLLITFEPSARALIYHMSNPCDKVFLLVLNILTLTVEQFKKK